MSSFYTNSIHNSIMTIGKSTKIENRIELDYVTPSIAMETVVNDDEAEMNSETTPLFQAIKDSKLVRLLRKSITTMPPKPTRSKFIFENTIEAARANMKLIEEHDFNINNIFQSEPDSTIQPKFEFRDQGIVSQLFDLSTDSDKLKHICFDGVTYPFRDDVDTSDDTRIADAEYWLHKGNNKSARGEEDLIRKIVDKEVSNSWGIVVPREYCLSVEGAGVVPATVAEKFQKIDEHDLLIYKKRMAHDCSNPGPSGQSVNNMVDDEILEECRFGFVLLQCLYEIHMLRLRYATMIILLSKYDLDAAYRRLSVALRYALLCGLAFMNLVYFCFRLPFGSKPAPALFSLVSEFIAELAQCLAEDKSWDPSELHSDMVDEIDTTPIYSSGPFGQADPLMIDYEPKKLSIRVFIDDLITICLAQEGLILRAIHAVPLVLDAVFRPNFDDELVNRNPILSQVKLLAEGILSETQIILGWLIDTRQLKLFITKEKAKRILIELKDLIKCAKNRTKFKKTLLESVVGKLQDISFIIPEGKFFLNRLRYRLKVMERKGNFRFFDEMELEDLILWMTIVDVITEGNIGRSTNSILPTMASILCISDACEHGIGGLIIVNGIGFAWRFIIPDEWMHYFSINFLEFFGASQCVKYVCDYITGQRLLSISDSMNALAWMDSNKFDPHLQPHHDALSRRIGKCLLTSDNCLQRGHVAGERNKITDSFSRDTHIPFETLINLLQQHEETKHMMPEKVIVLEENGDEVFSWLQSKVQNLPENLQKGTRRSRSGLFTGTDGPSSAERSINQTRFSGTSMLKETLQKSTTLKHSQNYTDIITSAKNLGFQFNPEQFQKASERLVQSSRIIPSKIQ